MSVGILRQKQKLGSQSEIFVKANFLGIEICIILFIDNLKVSIYTSNIFFVLIHL